MIKKQLPKYSPLMRGMSLRSNSASLVSWENPENFADESAGFKEALVPSSKSITNRAILMAMPAKGRSHLKNVLDCDDTQRMISICQQLGAKIEVCDDGSLVVEGNGGQYQHTHYSIYVGDSGTCARFLCAVLCKGHGTFVLHGSPRMQERPIGDLVDSLCEAGASIQYLGKEGCLPLKILANDGTQAPYLRVKSDQSSQFMSALLMLAPLTEDGLTLCMDYAVSVSYVDMTVSMPHQFGVRIESPAPHVFKVPSQPYQACTYTIPTDAPSASYFFALAVITGTAVRIAGLSEMPIQSDLDFVNVLRMMGCETHISEASTAVRGGKQKLRALEIDMNNMSDMVPTFAAVAMFADGVSTVYNVEHIRGKECDRISALCTELAELGAKITEYQDGLSIEPPTVLTQEEVLIHTYNDHRMAMAFAILKTRFRGIKLDNEACVTKTFPGFFSELERLLA